AARAANAGDRVTARENIVAAIAWYERGVKLGDPEISLAFAQHLHNGFGDLTVADVPSALVFYEIAAQQGSRAASLELARHFSGASVAENRDAVFPTAYFWAAILEADDRDDEHGFGRAAAALRTKLSDKLTDTQIAEVMRRVADWRVEFRTAPVAAK
ncbi:MAG: hypothetical protein OEU92_29595, partial [Alphaproteobacteria bacterium]|nr:hypothetical protein [Alphaproteobacteria bacterium]